VLKSIYRSLKYLHNDFWGLCWVCKW